MGELSIHMSQLRITALSMLFVIIGQVVPPTLVGQDTKVALVIGNASYINLNPLVNTSNDAVKIDASLKSMGFSSTLLLDANEKTTRRALIDFSQKSEGALVALVFYAGHGAQVNGQNFLLSIDMELPKRESDIQLTSIKVDDIIGSLRSKNKVIFLDACRDNPAMVKSISSKGRGGYRGGLSSYTANAGADSAGIFVAYATDDGNIALDGEEGNSPFTQALLQYIKEPISIDDMFTLVTKQVRKKTNNQQRPYKYASLDGILYLGKAAISNTAPLNSPTANNSSNLGDQWVYFEYNDKEDDNKGHFYIQPSSIKKIGNRTIYRTKMIRDKKEDFMIVDNVTDLNAGTLGVYGGFSASKLDQKIPEDDFSKYDMPETTKLLPVGAGSINQSSLTIIPNMEILEPDAEINNSQAWDKIMALTGVELVYLKKKFSINKDGKKIYTFKRTFPNEINISEDAIMFPDLKAKGFVHTPKMKSVTTQLLYDCASNTFVIFNTKIYNIEGQVVGIKAYYGDNWLKKITPTKAETLSYYQPVFNFICRGK